MAMRFRCTACTARLHVPSRWAGTTIECPKCATRVVVPRESPGPDSVRFEERSLEKRIEAFEAATIAAVTAARPSPSDTDENGPATFAGYPSKAAGGRRTLGGRIPLLAIAFLLAMAAAAAAGFWAGWLASQAAAK